MMKYSVSLLQYCPRVLDVDANLAQIESMLEGIETDLLVLPELAATGYVFASLDEVDRVAEAFPSGRSSQFFHDLAARKNISIVYGFTEKADGAYYNSAALVNPDGSHHLYRKVHLFDREKLFFTPGDRPFDIAAAKNGVQVGLMVCYDWQFPEAARSLALKGAQIICHPANLVLPWCQQAMLTRSLENRVFTITANRTGTETNAGISLSFTGQSQITGTKGEVLLRMDAVQEGIASVVIDPSLALDKSTTSRNDAFADRRPEMYYNG